MTRGNPTKASSRYAKTTTAVELVNPGTAGIVYDEAGNSVGGGERVTLAGDPDQVAMRQLEAGYLLAQRGTAWLRVGGDGELVDPTAADTTPDPGSAPEPAAVPAPRGNDSSDE